MKKILISHRGNLNGKNPEKENSIKYINEAIKKGFEVEVDVWLINHSFFLGHDKADYPVGKDFLKRPQLWCHAKNIDALFALQENRSHFFWHQEDDFALTSKGYIWTYPGKKLTKNSICVMPETVNYKYINNCIGICSDFIQNYKT